MSIFGTKYRFKWQAIAFQLDIDITFAECLKTEIWKISMNRGFLCIAYAMLCHSVAYTATIHRFTRTSVLELGKATLSQILLPNNIYRLNIILMAKLQLLAITTLDGYLFDRTVSSPLWDNPNKYGLTKIRERATQTLGPDVSFISLTQWKKKNEGIYFIEAALDTISVISSMFRYWLVDEIILFVAPYIQGDGIRLFTEIPGPSSWEMTGNKCFRSGICRLAYKRIE